MIARGLVRGDQLATMHLVPPRHAVAGVTIQRELLGLESPLIGVSCDGKWQDQQQARGSMEEADTQDAMVGSRVSP